MWFQLDRMRDMDRTGSIARIPWARRSSVSMDHEPALAIARGFWHLPAPTNGEPRDLEHEEEARVAGKAAQEEARQARDAHSLRVAGRDRSQGRSHARAGLKSCSKLHFGLCSSGATKSRTSGVGTPENHAFPGRGGTPFPEMTRQELSIFEQLLSHSPLHFPFISPSFPLHFPFISPARPSRRARQPPEARSPSATAAHGIVRVARARPSEPS